MSEIDALRAVIRKVDRREPVDETYQNLVPVKVGFGRYNYYLVSHNKTGRASVRGEMAVPVRSHHHSWSLNLLLKYSAMAASGLPEKVAIKIVDALGGDNPLSKLEQSIRDVMGEFISSIGGPDTFIAQYDKFSTALESRINNRIEDSVGLSLHVSLIPSTGGKPLEKTKRLDQELSFHLDDSSKLFKARLGVDLDAKPGVWPYIFCNSLDLLCNSIIESATGFLKTVTVQQATYEFAGVRDRLRKQVEDLANQHGRTVGHWSLELVPSIEPIVATTQRITLDEIVFPNLQQYPHPVAARCELQLDLESLGAYIERKSPDLREWAEATMRQSILKGLLDVPYIDLFLGSGRVPQNQSGFQYFDRKLSETEELVRKEAALIGFRISAISIRTNLQFDELRRGFTIEIRGEEFDTKVSGYPAALDIEVFARIADESKIRELFRRDADIKRIIRNTVREVIRQKLRKMSPEQYYTHFEGSDEMNSLSVLEELKDAVKQEMIKEYGATELRVDCIQQLTELAKLFHELQKDYWPISILDKRNHLEFSAVYRVETVMKEHWEQFQIQRPSPDKVKELVTDLIKQRLYPEGRHSLMQLPDHEIRDGLNRTVGMQDVPEALGVSVKIVVFTREPTSVEDEIQKDIDSSLIGEINTGRAIREKEWMILLSSLDELEQQRIAAVRSETPGEVERIDNLIEVTKARLSSHDESSPQHGIKEAVNAAKAREVLNLQVMPTERRSFGLASTSGIHEEELKRNANSSAQLPSANPKSLKSDSESP